jgi:hypothetical protein
VAHAPLYRIFPSGGNAAKALRREFEGAIQLSRYFLKGDQAGWVCQRIIGEAALTLATSLILSSV